MSNYHGLLAVLLRPCPSRRTNTLFKHCFCQVLVFLADVTSKRNVHSFCVYAKHCGDEHGRCVTEDEILHFFREKKKPRKSVVFFVVPAPPLPEKKLSSCPQSGLSVGSSTLSVMSCTLRATISNAATPAPSFSLVVGSCRLQRSPPSTRSFMCDTIR